MTPTLGWAYKHFILSQLKTGKMATQAESTVNILTYKLT